jgi:hypothetical protein
MALARIKSGGFLLSNRDEPDNKDLRLQCQQFPSSKWLDDCQI